MSREQRRFAVVSRATEGSELDSLVRYQQLQRTEHHRMGLPSTLNDLTTDLDNTAVRNQP